MLRWVMSAGLFLAGFALWDMATLEWSINEHSRLNGMLLAGLQLLLPGLIVGVLVDRWWAPSLAVSVLALPLVPTRCVWKQTSSDSFGGVCSGYNDEVLPVLAIAFASLSIGTAAAAMLRWLAPVFVGKQEMQPPGMTIKP